MTHRLWALCAALGVAAAAVPGAAPAQYATVGPRAREAGEPRVFLWRGENLVDARHRARGGDRRLRAAFAALERDAKAAMRVGPFSVVDKSRAAPSGDKHDYVSSAPYWWPDSTKADGLPYVRRDGVVNPEARADSDSPRFGQMVGAVETLALASWFGGDVAHARRAALLLRTWFLDPKTRMNPHLQYAQGIPGVVEGRGLGIIDTRDMARVVDAVGLLAFTTAWTIDDHRAMVAWCRDYLRWLRESAHGASERAEPNNHGTWYDAQVAALALFVGDEALARETVSRSAARRFATQVTAEGAQPLEAARTRPLHYTIFNLESFGRLAEIGRHVGVDFWRWQAPTGATLQQAARHVARYADSTVKMPNADVAPVPPAAFLLPLRRVVNALGDPVTAAAISKLPPDVVEADRSRLLYPDVP
jgi:hypothetical protein